MALINSLKSSNHHGSVLHYRDPVIYAEMLKIEGELQSKVSSNLVYAAVVWVIQVDGSLSRTMRDNKFVSARIIDKDLNMETVFLSVDVPKLEVLRVFWK